MTTRTIGGFLCAAVLGIGLIHSAPAASTAGSAALSATILDYPATSGTRHWTVVWVTTSAGTFIKTLWKQGPSSFTTTHWNDHCSVWYAAKGGSTAFDGYTTATAPNYSAPNSPINLTWNCRDAANALVADGNYIFWIQYSEDDETDDGPVTTSGLLWTKGPTGSTKNFSNQPPNFSNMSVTWTPSAVAPTITSAAPPAGTLSVPYSHACTASGTAPITFAASGLPAGLTIGAGGAVSGTPSAGGVFNGIITAANGTLPNATQSFSIVIGVVPAKIRSIRNVGGNLIISGTGPTNGTYTALASTNLAQPPDQWPTLTTGSVDAQGGFSFTTPIDTSPKKFYRVRVP